MKKLYVFVIAIMLAMVSMGYAANNAWNNSEFTQNLPRPEFVDPEPLQLKSGDDVCLRFMGVSGTSIDDLKQYEKQLTDEGFAVKVSESPEMHNAKVKNAEGNPVMEISYQFGRVTVDVYPVVSE